jgi:16S rRNA (adenine1518-N6/adenine1519-N6)-dimethyltransferase
VRQRGDRPARRRRLGQHHLRDARAAQPLVDFLRPAGRAVLEIGPGGGALTDLLERSGARRVLGIELDPAWAFHLGRAAASRPVAGVRTLVVADALALDWPRLPASWRVAGNLPYQIGTVLLERLLAGAPPGTICGFLLQKEVVDRLVAPPGTAAYGALSVLVAARARVTRLGTLRPGAFVPPPKVESAFVGLELTPAPLDAAGMADLERVVRAAFGQRRKTLRNALGAVFGRAPAEAALAAAGVAPEERAERLDLATFLRLAAELAPAL